MVRTLFNRKYYLSRKPKVRSSLSSTIFKTSPTRTDFISNKKCEMAKNNSGSESHFKIKYVFKKRICISKSNNSDRGQVLIFFLLLLPILGFLVTGLGTNLILLKSKMKQQLLCRDFTYQAQKEIVHGFNQLKNLNPKAKRLRQRRLRALSRLSRATNPYMAAAIAAEIAIITSQQIALKTKQDFIIVKSKTKAKLQLLKIPGLRGPFQTPFSLIAKPKLSLSPSYFNPVNLKYKQDITVNWFIKIPIRLTKLTTKPMEGQCGSHIKPKGHVYQIKYSYPDTPLLSSL